MRLPSPSQLFSRRAIASALSCSCLFPPSRSTADSGRVTAQTVGIEQESIGGIIWGGRERCDPTSVTCRAGGVEVESELVAQPVPQARLQIGQRFSLQFQISGQPAGQITVGLWSSAAPVSCETFSALARGSLRSDPDDAPATLERSTVERVLKNREVILGKLTVPSGSLRLVAGRTKPQRFPVIPPRNDDADTLSNDAAGLLSMRRGGGSTSFLLTPSVRLTRPVLA